MALDFETTEDPNAVESIFCEKMGSGKIEPLSEDMTKILVTLIMSDLIDEIHKDVASKTIHLKILEDRLKSMGKDIGKAAAVFVSLACETPGEAVMYSYYISYKMKQLGLGNSIDLDILCTDIFPRGLFTRETLDEVWDLQKVKRKTGSDNLLDYFSASKSLNC